MHVEIREGLTGVSFLLLLSRTQELNSSQEYYVKKNYVFYYLILYYCIDYCFCYQQSDEFHYDIFICTGYYTLFLFTCLLPFPLPSSPARRIAAATFVPLEMPHIKPSNRDKSFAVFSASSSVIIAICSYIF